MARPYDLQRAVDFRLLFARRQSAEVRPVPGGFLVRHDQYARSHEHNEIHIDGPVEPTELPAVADEAMAEFPHRRITVHDDRLGLACAPALTLAGYEHGVELVMTHTGPVAAVAGRGQVVEMDLGPDPYGPLWRALANQQRLWMPDADEETVRQMVGRRAARRNGAEDVRFLAVHDEDGEVASWADLYMEPADGIAQIEEVATAEHARRRGYADAVLSGALQRASEAGCALRFLVADGEDWPRHWYARRGFTTVGRAHVFSRFR
ncbi:GNAT family N-acetyltransferase [Streptomyces botrytidirepellens]|uniref:N-acetyltransferase n=1 Tax=Streptomyces botrytidirepellens TaxID=2486417 RepID=A0A3M8TF76_9ACTN|nr:GNAT family N-acetyltransferase [Streptomyces botrytidirepellens]RNF92219.1 N-acetyltransferase [Streptomyces botrytidirepellens]